MIVRTKRDRNYSVVSNAIVENPRLSFAAKGLLVYLLSRPDNWSVSYRQLAKTGTDGAHTVRRLLIELESEGYLVRTRINAGHKRAGWTSTIYDEPQCSPATDAQSAAQDESCAESSYVESSCVENRGSKNSCVEVRRRISTVIGSTVVGSTVGTSTEQQRTAKASSPGGEATPPDPAEIVQVPPTPQRVSESDGAETASPAPPALATPSAHQVNFDALCWIVGWDSKTLAKEQHGQVAQALGVLTRAGYGVDDLRRFWREVWLKDWRWQKHRARPSLSQLRAEIGKLRVNERELEDGDAGFQPADCAAQRAADDEIRRQIRAARERGRAAAATPSGSAPEGLRLPHLQGQEVGLQGRADERPALWQGVPLPLPERGGQGAPHRLAALHRRPDNHGADAALRAAVGPPRQPDGR